MKTSKRRHERARADLARASKLAAAGVRHEQRVTLDPEVTGLETVKRRAAYTMAVMARDTEEHRSAEQRYLAAGARLDELARERQARRVSAEVTQP